MTVAGVVRSTLSDSASKFFEKYVIYLNIFQKITNVTNKQKLLRTFEFEYNFCIKGYFNL